ncbi:MAG: deaminase [Patescibacteria group bacterium]|jgi:deoxycytidylate deaminase
MTEPIKYPYLPEGKVIQFVAEDNQFMIEAKKMAETTGCSKQPTGAVIVKNGIIIGRGCNAGKKIEVCPRVLNGSKTGEDYHYCKEVCLQTGHSEVTSTNNAKANGQDSKDADLYLYGHWWCCKNCWDTIIKARIKNVYLVKNSYNKFNFSSSVGKIYISGALTNETNSAHRETYQKIAAICSKICSNVYVPHLGGTDPIKNPRVSPLAVWKKDHHEVASADLIIAYVGLPSLGVGAELEIARITASDIILWWYQGEKVSRMARGNPAAVKQIEAKDENDLLKQLDLFLKNYNK